MRSITTSLLNAWRNSKASRATRTTASGSSPFTWKIGASIILATSVAYIGDRQDGEVRAALVDDVLLGADDALDDRVDRLQVGGVGGQRDRDLLAVQAGEGALGAQVVLHVAGAVHRLRVEVALELAEDLRVRLSDDVRQNVQAAAVGHADDDLVQAGLRRAVDHRVEQRDDRLAALEREALLADVLRLE